MSSDHGMKDVEQEEHENLLKEVRVLTAVFCAAALVLTWPWERPWHRDTRSTATWGGGGGAPTCPETTQQGWQERVRTACSTWTPELDSQPKTARGQCQPQVLANLLQ